jgi:hypothetical protein
MLGSSDHTFSNAAVNGASHPEDLVPQRLEAAGLDVDYLNVAVPDLVAALKRVCATCNDSDRCKHDFQMPDGNERVAAYCPNTPTIDYLQIERAIGKTF